MARIDSKPGFVDFGDVARDRCNQQCQYASRYININGKNTDRGYPQLGLGLRFENLDTGCYHDILIHADDVEEFVRRYKDHRAKTGPFG
jgi:hypothetical protein